jgi:hypothetical protein
MQQSVEQNSENKTKEKDLAPPLAPPSPQSPVVGQISKFNKFIGAAAAVHSSCYMS